jgi:hypothetical protein
MDTHVVNMQGGTMDCAVSALVVALSVVPMAAAGKPAQGPSCSRAPRLSPEEEEALDAVHRAKDGSRSDSERVVTDWFPKTKQALSSEGHVSNAWLHVAVDLGRELIRLERGAEAVPLLRRVVELRPEGEWGAKAARLLADLNRSQR